jgi:hypothetical protein
MGTTQRELYSRFRDALKDIGLVDSRRLLGNRTAPEPLEHRAFRLDPSRLRNGDGSGRRRGAPGKPEAVELLLVVHLSHDSNPSQPDEAYLSAVDDAEAAVDKLETSLDLRRIARVRWQGTSIRESANHIEQDLTFEVSYDFDLSEAS